MGMSKTVPPHVQERRSPPPTLGLVCDADWLTQCATNGVAKALPTLANAMLALRFDPALYDVFAFDQMLQTAILLRPLNLINKDDPDFEVWPVTDLDVTELQEWLQLAGLRHISKETVHDAIDLRASERAFHPIRDHLAASCGTSAFGSIAGWPTILALNEASTPPNRPYVPDRDGCSHFRAGVKE